jgi:hypothetical protein
VRAVSVDGRLADAIPSGGWIALVHSRYEKVVNLMSPEGRLFCVTTAALEDAPLTVRVAESTWAQLTWRVGEPVTVCPQEDCDLGSSQTTTISIGRARRWQPVVADLAATDVAHLVAAAAAIDRRLAHRPRQSTFELVVADEVSRRLAHLDHALRAGDIATIALTASDLIGLGAGLTPTGDDVLTGLGVLAGSRGTHLDAVRPALRLAIAGEHPLTDRTTSVSAAVLQEAVEGRGRQRLHDLVDAIARSARPQSAEQPSLAEAIRRVFAIGHSSGADILTGVRLGLRVEAHLRAAHDLAGATVPIRHVQEGIN